VAELLKLLHLFQRHGVAKMDVDAGRVDAVFDPQRRVSVAAFLQFRGELFFRADLLDPSANDGELLFNGLSERRRLPARTSLLQRAVL
jgi:hypothetical protein